MRDSCRTYEIEVSGGTIVARSLGHGPPIVFVHGWALDSRIWARQFALADRFTLVTFDRRGFGRSDAPADPAQEAADMLALWGALNFASADIVAMSQGARAALAFAARSSERVGRMVLQGPPCFATPPSGLPPEAIPIERAAALALRNDRRSLAELIGEHPLMRTLDGDSAMLVRAVVADYAGRDLGARAPAPVLDEALFATVGASTMILTGLHDLPMRHYAADWLAARLDRATRVTIGGSHLCNVDAAAEFNAELVRFLG